MNVDWQNADVGRYSFNVGVSGKNCMQTVQIILLDALYFNFNYAGFITLVKCTR